MNWFRKGKDNKFLWPGFGDNIRVIDWIIRRLDGEENIGQVKKLKKTCSVFQNMQRVGKDETCFSKMRLIQTILSVIKVLSKNDYCSFPRELNLTFPHHGSVGFGS